MMKEPDEKNKDESVISEAYQMISNELPSAELDKNILWQARQAADKTNEGVIAEPNNRAERRIKPKSAWFKWQWGGGLAASVLIISTIWMTENPEQELSHFPQAVPLSIETTPLEAEDMSANRTAMVDVMADTNMKQSALLQDVAMEKTPARLNSASIELADTQSLELQTKLPSNEETQNEPVQLERIVAEVKANRLNETNVGQYKETELNPALSSTQAFAAASDFKSGALKPDVELDESLKAVKRYQRVLYNTEIQNAEDEKRLTQELSTAQQKLIELIQSKKQQQPDWIIEAKYLEALTQDQAKQLLGED